MASITAALPLSAYSFLSLPPTRVSHRTNPIFFPRYKVTFFVLDLRGMATWRRRVKRVRQWIIYIDIPVLWKGGGGRSGGHHELANHASGISSRLSSVVGRPPHVRAAAVELEAEELVLASSLKHKEGIRLLLLRLWLRDLQEI
jgi:hypothetical protein